MFLILHLAAAQIYVYSPESLRDQFKSINQNGEIYGSLGNFGNPPYGSVIVGSLYKPINDSELNGCNQLTHINFHEDPDKVKTPLLIVERGECYFVQKVRNAQNIGAKGVIIVDQSGVDIRHVVMADNGTGGDLSIPAFLISKNDGQVLYNALDDPAQKDHVALTLVFDIIKTKDKVDFRIWYSAEDQKATSLIRELSLYSDQFDKQIIYFKPHIMSYTCHECRNHNFQGMLDNCISGGKYCAMDPDFNGPLTGKDVMMENIRQICIYNSIEQEQTYQKWFTYMGYFNSTCAPEHINEDCSNRIMFNSKVNQNKVSQCLNGSVDGSDIDIDDNLILKYENELRRQFDIHIRPSITINNITYRGDWEAGEILLAICSGYSQKPQFCIKRQYKVEQDDADNGIPTVMLIPAFVVVLLFFTCLLIVYRFYMKREMRKALGIEVNHAISQYVALSEKSDRD